MLKEIINETIKKMFATGSSYKTIFFASPPIEEKEGLIERSLYKIDILVAPRKFKVEHLRIVQEKFRGNELSRFFFGEKEEAEAAGIFSEENLIQISSKNYEDLYRQLRNMQNQDKINQAVKDFWGE